jgi:hypothetical protein
MLEIVILLLAVLVLVPLGLRLSDDPARGPRAQRLLKAAQWLQPAAAISLGASFALEQSWLAAWLALPWFAVTLLLAGVGVLDAYRRGWRLDGQAGFTAGLLFIPVGGSWAVISRAGLRPQDFSHAIVLLTAVHFHYAGFVLPIVAGLAASNQADNLPRLRVGLVCDRFMLAAIILGVPLVGVGISLSPHVEIAGAVLLAIGCVILAVRQLQAALNQRNATVLALLCVSSLALLSAMALAAIYAVGQFTGHAWLEIPTMIRTHGAANAFGFATCGLLGWAAKVAGTHRVP